MSTTSMMVIASDHEREAFAESRIKERMSMNLAMIRQ